MTNLPTSKTGSERLGIDPGRVPFHVLDQGTAEDWIEEANRMAYTGRVREAVVLLAEADRRNPAPELAGRLVRLRHEAFAEIPATPGRRPWPPEVPDRFAPDGGLPEVQVGELSAEALSSAIVHHGALIVRGLLAPSVAASLRADIDRAFTASSQGWAGAPVEETSPWYVPFNPGLGYNLGWGRGFVIEGGGVWGADSPRALARLLELFESVGLVDVLTGHLGERPAISVKKCTMRRVPTDTGSDWHQDGAFLGDGIRTVNCWLSLTHCGDTAPGLDIVPRRFDRVLETGTEGALFDWSVGQGVVDREAAEAGVVRPIFEVGDAILFDDHLLHRTAVSPEMTEERYAVETWFFAPSTYPTEQVALVV